MDGEGEVVSGDCSRDAQGVVPGASQERRPPRRDARGKLLERPWWLKPGMKEGQGSGPGGFTSNKVPSEDRFSSEDWLELIRWLQRNLLTGENLTPSPFRPHWKRKEACRLLAWGREHEGEFTSKWVPKLFPVASGEHASGGAEAGVAEAGEDSGGPGGAGGGAGAD